MPCIYFLLTIVFGYKYMLSIYIIYTKHILFHANFTEDTVKYFYNFYYSTSRKRRIVADNYR